MLKHEVLKITFQVTGYVLYQTCVVMVPANISGVRNLSLFPFGEKEL